MNIKNFDELRDIVLKQNEKIEEISKKIDYLYTILEKKSSDEHIKKHDLSIIVKKHKKSILIKNMYENKNTTINHKELFKELGAKWNSNEKGWLFVSLYNEEITIQENVKFLIDKCKELNINLELEYE